MRSLGAAAESAGRVYFTGGASALLMRWRDSTIDIDLKLVPEQDALFRALPALKERLEMNIELAAPDQFIPAIDGWEERSPAIGVHGKLSFHHYDFYSQALAKIERRHVRDVEDVRAMFNLGLVEPARVIEYFRQIEPKLFRYPAIDPPSFRRAVESIAREDNGKTTGGRKDL